MNKPRILLGSIVITLFFLVFHFLFGDFKAAFAHRPHDVVSEIEISQNYQQDRTLFIIVRGNLLRSTDAGTSWQRIVKGLDGGANFSSLSISPTDKQLLFLSSRDNGIYKSQDRGLSWSEANNGLDNSNLDLISVSPLSSEIVLAAGTEKGLYKTENGGKTWKQVINGNQPITAIAFFPNDQKQVVVADNQGQLYRSNDGGDTWQSSSALKNSGAITTITVSPNFATDKTFLVGTETAGIFKTTDNGVSFTEANQGFSDKHITDIFISSNPQNELKIFASTWNAGLFYSDDIGETWSKLNQGITKDAQADQLKKPHFNKIAVSPTYSEDGTIFLGGFNGLFKSTNEGLVWQEVGTLLGGTIVSLDVSPDYGNDSTVIGVTYVGFPYISKDGGANWKAITKGLELPRFTRNFNSVTPNQDPRRFFDVAFSPNYGSDKTIFASILWTKFLRSTDGGESWKLVPLSKEVRGITIAPSPNFAIDKTVYLSNQRGIIFRSTDGGKNFSVVGNAGRVFGNDGPSLAISPDFASDKTLYTSGPEGVQKSLDGGKTWQGITQNSDLQDSHNINFAISPNYKEDRTVVVGTNRGVFITKDAGKSWVKLVNTAYGEDSYIEGLAISPDYKSDRTFLVSARGKGLFKTVNDGQNFARIGDDSMALARMNNVPSSGVPIQFSASYATDKTIYAFGDAGAAAFKSTDGGNSWERLAIPLQNPVYEKQNYNLATSISLMYYVYQGRILRILAAFVVGLLSYFVLGYLHLEKKIPLNKWLLKVGGASIIFATALIILHV